MGIKATASRELSTRELFNSISHKRGFQSEQLSHFLERAIPGQHPRPLLGTRERGFIVDNPLDAAKRLLKLFPDDIYSSLEFRENINMLPISIKGQTLKLVHPDYLPGAYQLKDVPSSRSKTLRPEAEIKAFLKAALRKGYVGSLAGKPVNLLEMSFTVKDPLEAGATLKNWFPKEVSFDENFWSKQGNPEMVQLRVKGNSLRLLTPQYAQRRALDEHQS